MAVHLRYFGCAATGITSVDRKGSSLQNWKRKTDSLPLLSASYTSRKLNVQRWTTFCSFRTNQDFDGTHSYDVVVVGAGIVGTSIAHHILHKTTLSVVLVDAKKPCAGATGAGQGYIWMSHRNPGTAGWNLARRSKLLWEELVAELQASKVDPLDAMGWKNTGSLLVSSTPDEAQELQEWVRTAVKAGVEAEWMTAMEVGRKESALAQGNTCAAAFFPGDSQIDATLAMNLLQQRNRSFACQNRYKELYDNEVIKILCSATGNHIEGVQTKQGNVMGNYAVVVATGAWSSVFMGKATEGWDFPLIPHIKPRKGYLLVLKGITNIKLNHGMMEFEYIKHADHPMVEASVELQIAAPESSVELAMTATMDARGHLILGSSREFAGFNVDISSQVIERIWQQAAKFLPDLAKTTLPYALGSGKVRTVADGKPLIGPVEHHPGLIFATGHEGSGLCMALATAEMVGNMILQQEFAVDPRPFSPAGRLSHTVEG